jgi:hypothetical protein
MLGYVMGEDNRNAWLKRYLRERKFQHPDPYDLELFAEEESGLMLDWYFYQFTRSTRALDDEIDDLKNTATGGGYEASFTLEREGKIRMPHDVKLNLQDGSTQWVNVPLASMHGQKPVPNDWIVTDPWPWVYPEKTFTVEVPAPVESAELDPKGRTPDVNRLNNSTDFPLKTRFLKAPQSSWSHYEVGFRPLGLYAHDFGFGGGVQARGQYFLGEHALRATLTLWPEVLASNGDDPALVTNDQPVPDFIQTPESGSWIGGIDYEFRYEHPFPPFGARATVEASATKHLGVLENRIDLRAPLRSALSDVDEQLQFSLIQQYNPSDRAFGITRSERGTVCITPPVPCPTYNVVQNPWNQAHAVSGRLDYTIARGDKHVQAFAELGGTLGGVGQASRLGLNTQQTTTLGPLEGRLNFRLGLGADQLLPSKQFVLGGRSLEDQWRNDTYRQSSAALEEPAADAHLVGFGPSGPVAYLRGARNEFTGENVISGRLSVGGTPFPQVNPLSPLRLSAFSGVGTVWSEGAFFAGFDADRLVGDAGFGARYAVSEIPHLDRWTAQSDFLQGLDVVAKFPVWASDPGLIDPSQDELAFRWLIGVEL